MLQPINRLPTETEIRQRASEIFLAHGQRPGHAMDDWLQAEYELTQLPVEHLAKLGASSAKHSRLAVAELAQAAMLLCSWL